jgi:hypothetical protein
MSWKPDLKDYRVKIADENKETNHGAAVRPFIVFTGEVCY